MEKEKRIRLARELAYVYLTKGILVDGLKDAHNLLGIEREEALGAQVYLAEEYMRKDDTYSPEILSQVSEWIDELCKDCKFPLRISKPSALPTSVYIGSVASNYSPSFSTLKDGTLSVDFSTKSPPREVYGSIAVSYFRLLYKAAGHFAHLLEGLCSDRPGSWKGRTLRSIRQQVEDFDPSKGESLHVLLDADSEKSKAKSLSLSETLKNCGLSERFQTGSGIWRMTPKLSRGVGPLFKKIATETVTLTEPPKTVPKSVTIRLRAQKTGPPKIFDAEPPSDEYGPPPLPEFAERELSPDLSGVYNTFIKNYMKKSYSGIRKMVGEYDSTMGLLWESIKLMKATPSQMKRLRNEFDSMNRITELWGDATEVYGPKAGIVMGLMQTISTRIDLIMEEIYESRFGKKAVDELLPALGRYQIIDDLINNFAHRLERLLPEKVLRVMLKKKSPTKTEKNIGVRGEETKEDLNSDEASYLKTLEQLYGNPFDLIAESQFQEVAPKLSDFVAKLADALYEKQALTLEEKTWVTRLLDRMVRIVGERANPYRGRPKTETKIEAGEEEGDLPADIRPPVEESWLTSLGDKLKTFTCYAIFFVSVSYLMGISPSNPLGTSMTDLSRSVAKTIQLIHSYYTFATQDPLAKPFSMRHLKEGRSEKLFDPEKGKFDVEGFEKNIDTAIDLKMDLLKKLKVDAEVASAKMDKAALTLNETTTDFAESSKLVMKYAYLRSQSIMVKDAIRERIAGQKDVSETIEEARKRIPSGPGYEAAIQRFDGVADTVKSQLGLTTTVADLAEQIRGDVTIRYKTVMQGKAIATAVSNLFPTERDPRGARMFDAVAELALDPKTTNMDQLFQEAEDDVDRLMKKILGDDFDLYTRTHQREVERLIGLLTGMRVSTPQILELKNSNRELSELLEYLMQDDMIKAADDMGIDLGTTHLKSTKKDLEALKEASDDYSKKLTELNVAKRQKFFAELVRLKIRAYMMPANSEVMPPYLQDMVLDEAIQTEDAATKKTAISFYKRMTEYSFSSHVRYILHHRFGDGTKGSLGNVIGDIMFGLMGGDAFEMIETSIRMMLGFGSDTKEYGMVQLIFDGGVGTLALGIFKSTGLAFSMLSALSLVRSAVFVGGLLVDPAAKVFISAMGTLWDKANEIGESGIFSWIFGTTLVKSVALLFGTIGHGLDLLHSLARGGLWLLTVGCHLVLGWMFLELAICSFSFIIVILWTSITSTPVTTGLALGSIFLTEWAPPEVVEFVRSGINKFLNFGLFQTLISYGSGIITTIWVPGTAMVGGAAFLAETWIGGISLWLLEMFASNAAGGLAVVTIYGLVKMVQKRGNEISLAYQGARKVVETVRLFMQRGPHYAACKVVNHLTDVERTVKDRYDSRPTDLQHNAEIRPSFVASLTQEMPREFKKKLYFVVYTAAMSAQYSLGFSAFGLLAHLIIPKSAVTETAAFTGRKIEALDRLIGRDTPGARQKQEEYRERWKQAEIFIGTTLREDFGDAMEKFDNIVAREDQPIFGPNYFINFDDSWMSRLRNMGKNDLNGFKTHVDDIDKIVDQGRRLPFLSLSANATLFPDPLDPSQYPRIEDVPRLTES